MSKQYAVIGLGKFGFSVATTLAQAGKEVLAVDKDAEPVQEIADLVTYAARADITDSRVFASLGISNMDVVIVGISENMESSILATLQAKEAGVPLVIAKCMSQMHANILKKVGADRVVMAESETGIRLGKSLISGGFQDFFMLSDSFSMVELPVPEEWTGHNLEELDLRKKYSINVIAVKDGEDIRVTVNPKTLLRAEEVLILIGENKELAKLMKTGNEGTIHDYKQQQCTGKKHYCAEQKSKRTPGAGRFRGGGLENVPGSAAGMAEKSICV